MVGFILANDTTLFGGNFFKYALIAVAFEKQPLDDVGERDVNDALEQVVNQVFALSAVGASADSQLSDDVIDLLLFGLTLVFIC